MEDQDLTTLRECGKGVGIVMESLRGRYFPDSFESFLNSGGALVTYGSTSTSVLSGALVTFGSTSYVSPGLGKNMLRFPWRYLNRPQINPGTLIARNMQVSKRNK